MESNPALQGHVNEIDFALTEANKNLEGAYAQMRDWKDRLSKRLYGEEIGFLLDEDARILGVTEKAVETFDYTATAMTLVALYQNAQKEEHKTLRRYIKDRIYIESYNPHVLNLMSVKGGGIGEEKAKALIDRYGTFWYVINQSVEELAETLVGEEGKEKKLGVKSVQRLFKAIGRNI